MSVEAITAAMATLAEAREAEAAAVRQIEAATMAARKAVEDHHKAAWWEGKTKVRDTWVAFERTWALARVDGRWATLERPTGTRGAALPGARVWDSVAGPTGAVSFSTESAVVDVETGVPRGARDKQPRVNIDDLRAAVAAWRGREG